MAGSGPKRSGRASRSGLLIGVAILLVCALAGATLRDFGFEFSPPHHARASGAVLDAPLQHSIEEALDGARPTTVDEAIAFSLTVTDRSLHFGLGHPTKLSFGLDDREGNCIEYAHLFAKIFDLAVGRASLRARAYAIHSEHARVLGETVPLRGWGDHDWVLVDARTGKNTKRLFVDPTLHDFGVGWDISHNVKGAATLP